jgi:hypothetical protein
LHAVRNKCNFDAYSLGFFFGHSITQMSVMRKTKNVQEINSVYYAWINDSLVQQAIAQLVFNDAQTGIPQGNEQHQNNCKYVSGNAISLAALQFDG